MSNRIEEPQKPQPDSVKSNGQPQTGDSAGTQSPADVFTDLAELQLSQNFVAMQGVKKELLTIPVCKPTKEWFVRTHREWQIPAYILDLKEDRDVYIVKKPLWSELAASEST